MNVDLIDSDAWFRSEVEELVLTVTDENGTPLDLTDPSITALEFRIKKSAGDAEPSLLELSLGDGISPRNQVGAGLGVAEIVVSSERTLALAAGDYHYDVLLVIGGKRKLVIEPSRLRVEEVV